jgi:hypothetical protein
MIKFFKGLLSSKTIVDSAASGLDVAFFTKEEKSQAFLEFVKASAPMNISRRFIALAVSFLWALNGLILMGLSFLGHPQLEVMVEFAKWYVMPPFTVLVSFYFWKVERGK